MKDIIINILFNISNIITKILKFIYGLDENIKNILLILICCIALLVPIFIVITISLDIGYKFLEFIVWLGGQA